MQLKLSGLFKFTADALTLGVSSSDVATAMPNVPSSERAAISTAINNAANGQSFTAQDLLATLSGMGYWYCLTSTASCFSDSGGTTPCSSGDGIQVVKSWLTHLDVLQPTSGRRPTFNGSGSTFVKSNNQFLYSTTDLAYPNTAATIMCTVAPTNTSSSNGHFCKVGDGSSGYGLGVGTADVDMAGNNLIGLLEVVRWIPSSTSIGITPSINVLTTDSTPSVVLYHNGSRVASGPRDPVASSGGFSIGCGLGTGGSLVSGAARFYDGKIYSVILKNTNTTPSQITQLTRFLSFYHGLGLF